MKTILSALLFISLTTSCLAQKEISALSDNSLVKAKRIQYHIKKLQKIITIDNIANKLTNIKQSSPNIPLNATSFDFYYKNLDLAQIIHICADALSLEQIEEMLKTKNSSIFINIKSNLGGVPLEITFAVDKNSILSLKQIEEIEINIKKQIRITFKPEATRYLKDSNFMVSNPSIWFTDILKAKKNIPLGKIK
ncbi:MAG: hypothetical protein V4541_08580 [Bacteroidota bacterium]